MENFETDNEMQTAEQIATEERIETESPESFTGGDKLRYINFTPPDPDEKFWTEIDEVRRKPKSKSPVFILLTCLLIIAVIGYAIILGHGKGWFKTLFGSNKIEFTLPIAETPEVEDKYLNDDGSYTAAGIAKAALPSVVQIQVYSSSALLPSGQGSGIIVSEDGYIVTNAHVVSDADFGITVMLYDGTEYAATIVGSDESSDIAVIKIGGGDFTPAQFADSDTCELGDEVVTIGSPAGYENSVTKGIISGLDRQIHAENSATAMECIQIDAAINPGNSGGALFNMWGQVIGITSSKLVSESYDNIGFAITINSAKPIIEELMENGYVPDKARVGITYYAISEEAAKLYNVVAGLYVNEIDETCNVASTGLQVGDIITEMNGTPTTDSDAVSQIMSGLRAGDEMTCKVYRPSDEEGASADAGTYFEITFTLDSDKTAMIEAQESESE